MQTRDKTQNTSLFGRLTRKKISLHCKHLTRRRCNKVVDLARVLLHLSAVEHALKPAGFLGQLEQPLPLVLGEEGLLEGRAGGILRLALLLPVIDLRLFTGKRALVVLEVVGLGVVGLDAIQEQVAVLLHEGINAEQQVVEVRGENCRLSWRARFKCGKGRRKISRPGLLGGLELVDERCDQVRVVDGNRKFDENILVSQVRLLQSITRQQNCSFS